MKKTISFVMLIAILINIAPQLSAQETTSETLKTRTKSNNANEKTGGWNLKENVKCRVSSTGTGCVIAFNHEVKSPRDVATGQSSGKRQHKPYNFIVSSADNKVSAIDDWKSPTAKSGMGSGKASFSDLSVMMTVKGKTQKLEVVDGEFSLPSDCPDGACDLVLSWSWGESNSGSSNRCTVGFTAVIENGVCMAINEKGLPSGPSKPKGNVKN